jgi:protein-tyrosine phosphatase
MSTTSQPETSRRLAVDGLHNARDLGGFDTRDGRTRHRVVVRSEVPTLITAAGRQALHEHGIARHLDLRSDEEAEEEPSPFAGARGYRRVSILDRHAMITVRTMDRSEELMRFLLFRRSEFIAEALLNLLDLSAEGGVLIHCRAGKDRTGALAALLLGNAGVEPQVIAADHALSADNLEPLFVRWARIARNEEERALASMRKFAPTRESMLLTLAEVTARHGGVPQYLRRIGLTADEVAALRLLLVAAPHSDRAAA